MQTMSNHPSATGRGRSIGTNPWVYISSVINCGLVTDDWWLYSKFIINLTMLFLYGFIAKSWPFTKWRPRINYYFHIIIGQPIKSRRSMDTSNLWSSLGLLGIGSHGFGSSLDDEMIQWCSKSWWTDQTVSNLATVLKMSNRKFPSGQSELSNILWFDLDSSFLLKKNENFWCKFCCKSVQDRAWDHNGTRTWGFITWQCCPNSKQSPSAYQILKRSILIYLRIMTYRPLRSW